MQARHNHHTITMRSQGARLLRILKSNRNLLSSAATVPPRPLCGGLNLQQGMEWTGSALQQHHYSSKALTGKNIFQAHAAANAAHGATSASQHSQQGPSSVQPQVPIVLPTSDESEKLLRIRHSCAHIMAMAVQRVHKGAQVTIGPWIERGFYYDFDIKTPLTDKDLSKIQKEMSKIIKANLPFIREEVSREEAERRIREINEPYKLEILQSILARTPDAPITIYHIGEPGHPQHWWDLCAGPHVERTGEVDAGAIELESVAGAYWRGDENNPMLQRIYGTAWETAEQLKAYKHLKEEAAKRDHRKLGQQLDLFSIQECTGSGLVLWHPKGWEVRSQIVDFWTAIHKDKRRARPYEMVGTPHVAKADLWRTSGHLDFYHESMFGRMKVEDEEYQLKPMNCPFHVAIYKRKTQSYNDLPQRYAEIGTVYRYERSGTMHGLFRARGFTQDDAHIFCTQEQIAPEIRGVLDLVEEVLSTFGFTAYEVNLSTRPDKSVGSDEIWHTAESALVEALQAKGWQYKVDAGGGAFYGPKIDIKIQDAIGRKWQCSTIQLDFNLPERFDMEYVDASNTKQRPIMIHRAIFGSIERFMGIIIENYAGAFPMWLAPTQLRLLCVSDDFAPYAHKVAAEMQEQGIRVEVKGGASVSKLVRTAQQDKVPVACIVGAKEVEAGTLSVRLHGGVELGALPAQEVLDRCVQAIKSKGAF